MENDKEEETLVSIPLDLMIEILTRLPSKSLMKFKCLSKPYSSIIRSVKFVDWHFSYSSNKPHLLFSNMTANKLEFYSATTTSSSSTVASHVMTVLGNMLQIRAPPVRGLICYSINLAQHVICNPSTRQLLHLPQNQYWTKATDSFEHLLFGYEPISSRFKIISIFIDHGKRELLQFCILTVGDGNSWRKIQDIPSHYRHASSSRHGICINGILYYLGHKKSINQDKTVVSFDLNSEKFRLIDLPPGHLVDSSLIDFQGKLAFVTCSKEIRVWILENAEKHEWSSKSYNLPSTPKYSREFYENSDAVGICEGEMFFVPKRDCMYWHFNLDKKTIREVASQMTSNNHHLHLHVFANHVENLVSL